MACECEQLAGIDWRATFRAIQGSASAATIAAALTPIIGSAPTVEVMDGVYSIVFTPEQEDRLAAWVVMQLDREPGPVRVELGGAALKVISRKYWPYAAGAVALGMVFGFALRGGK